MFSTPFIEQRFLTCCDTQGVHTGVVEQVEDTTGTMLVAQNQDVCKTREMCSAAGLRGAATGPGLPHQLALTVGAGKRDVVAESDVGSNSQKTVHSKHLAGLQLFPREVDKHHAFSEDLQVRVQSDLMCLRHVGGPSSLSVSGMCPRRAVDVHGAL